MKSLIRLTLTICCLLIPAVSFGDVIADSAADFSDAQGPNWLNGYYNQTADVDGTFSVGDFIPFLDPDYIWTGSAWDEANVDGDNVPWTTIDANSGHPNGDNNGDVHYAIRRWVSDTAGPAEVTYNLSKANVNCGNGTSAILFHNGAEVSRLAVEGGDGVGLSATNMITLAGGDIVDLALSPEGPDASFADGCDGSAFGLTIDKTGGPVVPAWEDVFNLGAPGRDWRAADGGVQFVQEAGENDPPGDPNSPAENQQADDDYYTAGTYPDPIGAVAEELVMERAFAGTDNRLSIHFNVDGVNADDKLRFSFNANNLHNDQGDSRYGAVVDINGTEIIPEVIYAQDPASGLPVGTISTSAVFTAGDVGLVGGGDNVLTLTGVNYSADGGGNWMGMDYHHLEIMPVPEPGALSMLLCGLFWTIPLVCWENKKK